MKKAREITEWFLCAYFVLLSTQYIGVSVLVTVLTLIIAAVICPLNDKWIISVLGRRTVFREILAGVLFFFAVALAP